LSFGTTRVESATVAVRAMCGGDGARVVAGHDGALAMSIVDEAASAIQSATLEAMRPPARRLTRWYRAPRAAFSGFAASR
jgi:hypothetical protein